MSDLVDFTQAQFEMELGYNYDMWSLVQENDNYIVVLHYHFNKTKIVKKPREGWSLTMLDWIQLRSSTKSVLS